MLKLLSFTILWYILWRRNEDNLRVRDNNCTRYFNPRSPCGERLRCSFQLLQAFSISIHAPRAGSDKGSTLDAMPLFISIHAPRAGSDYYRRLHKAMPSNFNPRSPCGERRYSWMYIWQFCIISIHAPRAGSDGSIHYMGVFEVDISIHAPRAGSDKQDVRGWARSVISIHAPRAGSDRLLSYDLFALGHFNPRSPCGERPDTPTRSPAFSAFQSTLPVRGATLPHLRMAAVITISIHAPRAGSDTAGN